jgi:hypothetical protein
MRGLLCTMLAVGLTTLTSGTARADDQASLKGLIDKAIAAHGGKEKLAKNKCLTMEGTGKINVQGQMIDFTMYSKVQKPDKSKVLMDLDIMGEKFSVLQVVNGDQGWTKNSANNQVTSMAMTREQLAEQKLHAYHGEVESLVVLTGKEYKLAPLGESKVGECKAIGIRVSSAGHGDVNLYLDKETNLLLKSEFKVKDTMNGNNEISHEIFFSDYKDAEGLKYPARIDMKRAGVDYFNADVTEWVPSEKLDDGEFAMP